MESTAKERGRAGLRRSWPTATTTEVDARAGRGGDGKGGSTPRYHAIDALRGMAMFLVITLHAALGYLRRDIPGVLWCVRDAPTLPAFDWFCWWSMGVSNPLYFTIAGFFAVHLYESKGLRGFAVNRARRVLVPFLAALVTLGPFCLAAWIYGWFVAGRCNLRQIRHLRFRDPRLQAELLGPGHLWFLEYLMLMLAIYGLLRWWGGRQGRPPVPGRARRLFEAAVASPWRPLLLALPTTALLWVSRGRIGIDAVLDRHNSFLPDPTKFLHHGLFFVVGAVLYRVRYEFDSLSRLGAAYLAASLPVFAARAYLLDRDWTAPLHGPAALALAASGALFGWLMVFGFLGLFLRVVRRSHPAVRYLADSSYWIYLMHMPVVGLIQVDLYRIPGHALWKFPVVWATTLALGFASYQTLVRHTAIGAWLHGPRERPMPSPNAAG